MTIYGAQVNRKWVGSGIWGLCFLIYRHKKLHTKKKLLGQCDWGGLGWGKGLFYNKKHFWVPYHYHYSFIFLDLFAKMAGYKSIHQ